MSHRAQSSPEMAFKRTMAIITSLIFGSTVTAVACIQPDGGHVLQMKWRWFAAILGVAAFGILMAFWQQLWRTESCQTPAEKHRLFWRGALVVLGAVGALIYPLRFVPEENLLGVIVGLSAATIVLTSVGFVIHKLIRMLSDQEPEDGEVFRGQNSEEE